VPAGRDRPAEGTRRRREDLEHDRRLGIAQPHRRRPAGQRRDPGRGAAPIVPADLGGDVVRDPSVAIAAAEWEETVRGAGRIGRHAEAAETPRDPPELRRVQAAHAVGAGGEREVGRDVAAGTPGGFLGEAIGTREERRRERRVRRRSRGAGQENAIVHVTSPLPPGTVSHSVAIASSGWRHRMRGRS
jgi:hypothetical protein